MKQEVQLPRLPLALFRWFCHPKHLEEVEGDLLEQFQLNLQKHGASSANRRFTAEVLRLFRPEIIGDFHFLTHKISAMKTSGWLQLIAINCLFFISMSLPFLPGPPNKLAQGLWLLAQVTGIFALLSLPVCAAWAVVELRRRKSKKPPTSHWNSGFYFATAATLLGTAMLLLMSFLLWEKEGLWAAGAAWALLAAGLWKVLPGLRSLQARSQVRPFNLAPFFVMSILVLGLLANLAFAGHLIAGGRKKAIQDCQPLISSIEEFKARQGSYPDRLDELPKGSVPTPGVMGISAFDYEKMGNAYQISFRQNLGESEEVVVYHPENQHLFKWKWHNENTDAGVENWRYYWID